jgi:hydrogenase expression/formation protein HypC
MCLGIPGRIVEILPAAAAGTEAPSVFAELRRGIVDFGGVRKEVCLSCVEDAGPGDYVIVHVGFAISKIDAEEAAEVFRLLREMEEAGGFGEPEPPGPPGQGAEGS